MMEVPGNIQKHKEQIVCVLTAAWSIWMSLIFFTHSF
jgi:hypothetical protein